MPWRYDDEDNHDDTYDDATTTTTTKTMRQHRELLSSPMSLSSSSSLWSWSSSPSIPPCRPEELLEWRRTIILNRGYWARYLGLSERDMVVGDMESSIYLDMAFCRLCMKIHSNVRSQVFSATAAMDTLGPNGYGILEPKLLRTF